MRILVTGAAGFIGSHLVDFLLGQSHEVTGIDNFDPFYPRKIKENNLQKALGHNRFQFIEMDILHSKELIKHLKAAPSHLVLHLAAQAGLRASLDNPTKYIKGNVEVTVALLDAMAKTGHRNLIFASSSSIYGTTHSIPFVETDGLECASSVYASSKQAGEIFTRLYHNIYRISVINLRFFTVYGPRQRPDLVVHRFLKANLLEENIVLFGDGSMARDYTYIEDVLQGIDGAVKRIVNSEAALYETYNLGNQTPVALHELVAVIERICNKKCRVKHGAVPLGDIPITCADISRAQKYLGYSPDTSIEEGLQEMYPWIKSLYSNL